MGERRIYFGKFALAMLARRIEDGIRAKRRLLGEVGGCEGGCSLARCWLTVASTLRSYRLIQGNPEALEFVRRQLECRGYRLEEVVEAAEKLVKPILPTLISYGAPRSGGEAEAMVAKALLESGILKLNPRDESELRSLARRLGG